MTAVDPLVVVRSVHLASMIAIVGCFAFRQWVLRGLKLEGPAAIVERRLIAWCGAALAIGVLSWLAWLVLTASGMSGMPVRESLDGTVLGTVVSRTSFGQVWAFRLVGMLALGVCLMAARRSGWARTMAATLALASLMSLAATGHPVGGSAADRPLHVASDALHLLGAGAWLGALLPLLFVLNRASGDSDWQALASQATRRFSALGLSSVSLLLASGLLNAAWLVGSWAALGATDYGRLVFGKVALFAIVIAIAAVNRQVLTPRLEQRAAPHRAVQSLRRNVIVEIGIGATIIAIASLLGTTPPSAHDPSQMHDHMHPAAHAH